MEKPFVLIIEDERDVAALFRHALDLAGYRTEIASHGKVAVERLSKSQPDIVLLDLKLPGVSGAEILQMMSSDERLKGIPVVVITAYSLIADNLSIEPDLVLLKPISLDQLTDLLKRLRLKEETLKTTPWDKTPWDRITGLYNRSFFMNRLDYALKTSKNIGQNLFAVLLMDLDQYKGIKNQFGKERSGYILRETAKSLKTIVRPTDTIARFKEDHFFILIENVPDRDIPIMIATRIQERLRKHLAEIEKRVQILPRIGIILCDNRYNHIDEILRDVKIAHSLAKADGEGGYKIFDRDTIMNTYGNGKFQNNPHSPGSRLHHKNVQNGAQPD
jgi:diguanylate cyclase (GGDEF)-like protein